MVEREDMGELVRGIIADVLMVSLDAVQPDSRLVLDLGAESIDFLDLVFRLEESLGMKIPVQRWTDFVGERLAGQDLRSAITADVVREFAELEARRSSRA